MMRKWMARQTGANDRMKNRVLELERQINQGLRNRQAIIENLERQFKYLEKTQHTQSLPLIEDDATKPIPTVHIPYTNAKTFADCIVHIPYTNAKTFADAVLPNHIGDKELKYVDGVGNAVLTKKKIKKNDKGKPKESNKEWKLNDKVVPRNKEVYHYQWHPTKIPHLNPDNEGGCLEEKSIDLRSLC
ncbi:hypothetical protein Tco_0653546 [Tanacetum coccineum]|uniref:Uncharacterized protein n=1 Tax=Tanacetum coccineum TaxID=301880 RepID=A0ABQ4X0V7_9ASTR